MSELEATQQRVVEFLRDTLPPPVRITETHVSVVFLSVDRALKLKKSVRFPFLDFTTLEARRAACKREFEINHRTAPSVYRGVVAVTETADGLALGGDGTTVEWLVDMARFDEETLFDRLAEEPRGLRRPMMESLADVIWRFHERAPVVRDHGGYNGIKSIAENNGASFANLPTGTFDQAQVDHVVDQTLRQIKAAQDVLDARQASGFVRVCHGDLHLRNICLVDGEPTLFDAIEFSRDFSDIDILYDLAFLLMDLDFRGHRRLAAFVQNRYLDVATAGEGAFRALPIFLSMRAQIRAHVGAAIAHAQDDEGIRRRETARANAYLELASSYLTPSKPRLVAVGGLSGSGKSRLAREIASSLGNAPGARVIRTDVVRKRLKGVHPNQKLGSEGYTAEMTERTYDAFYQQARRTLAEGQSVVLDAVHAMHEQRDQAERLAKSCGVPFQGLWVSASEEVRLQRVVSRKNNVSDVTPDIARQQSGYDLGDIDWAQVDSSGEKQATIDQALKVLRN